MHIIGIIFSIIVAALFVYEAVTFWLAYRAATGTVWQRLLGAAESSATILWSHFCIAVAFIAAQLAGLADLAGAPEAATFINTWVGNPKMIAALMLAIAYITIWARKRTL